MIIEERTVIKTETVYIAEDGREFERECDCIDHERFIKEQKIRFYDHNLERCDLNRSCYVVLETKEDVDNLLDVLRHELMHTDDICEPGIYRYRGDNGRWLNISDVVDTLRNKKE